MAWINTKQGKIWTVAIIILVAVAVWYFAFREKKPVMRINRDADDEPESEAISDMEGISENNGINQAPKEASSQEELPDLGLGNQQEKAPPKADPTDPFPLKPGMKHPYVENVQNYLRVAYKANIPTSSNGVFDEITTEALQQHMQHKQVSKQAFIKRDMFSYNNRRQA